MRTPWYSATDRGVLGSLGRPAVVVARAGTRTKVCMISTFVAMTGGNATASS